MSNIGKAMPDISKLTGGSKDKKGDKNKKGSNDKQKGGFFSSLMPDVRDGPTHHKTYRNSDGALEKRGHRSDYESEKGQKFEDQEGRINYIKGSKGEGDKVEYYNADGHLDRVEHFKHGAQSGEPDKIDYYGSNES